MPQFEPLLLTYLYLAHASQLRRQLLVRDKLLVLVGVTALELGWDEISASCRQRVLLHNPRHMIRCWPDLATAARAERFRAYLKQLRRKYSPEKAEHMLHALGISLDDPPDAGQGLRDRAATLVESLAPEPDDALAGRPAAPRGSASQVRKKPASGAVSASAPFPAASWWPFWLGLVLWMLLALIVVFGRGWSA